MCRKAPVAALLILLSALWVDVAPAQEETATSSATSKVTTIKPNYLPPSEIMDFLGVTDRGGRATLEWKDSDGWHSVDIRHNDAANLLVISGDAADVDFVQMLIREADISPRQIQIEVKIVEVSTSMARDLGIDWENVVNRSGPKVTWGYSEYKDNYERYDHSDRYQLRDEVSIRDDVTHITKDLDRYLITNDNGNRTSNIRRNLNLSAGLNFSDVLSLLDEAGAATVRNAPRILTLNNRTASILDGERVTYVTRYSGYNDVFKTDSMDAGLALTVLPSLGESGYITLRINAELTSLGDSRISGSPVKEGQMVENTVIVKDGESVLLGGLSRSVDRTVKKRFPILGHVLPFLFSREITIKENFESLIILTPTVVDFATALDEETIDLIEGK